MSTGRWRRDVGGGALVGEALRFCAQMRRRDTAARLRRATTAASAPGPEEERRAAQGRARAEFFRAAAMCLGSSGRDELTEAMAEFCRAEAAGYATWR